MKKITLLIVLLTSYIFSNINAVVSILPQKTFLKAIGGDKVDITLMVQPGSSPHTYEPKPSQMLAIANADLYFAIGVEFEHVWLPKFQNLNKQMITIDTSDKITKIHMTRSHDKKHDIHKHESKDPHIWTDPHNVEIIAKNIYEALVKKTPEDKKYFQKNLDAFLMLVKDTDVKIKHSLAKLKQNRTFMVFHPSWGYFSKAYNLKQIAVEVEGKSPKPKELMRIITYARSEGVKAIFTQPEFSDSVAKIISNELHIPVVKVSPMSAQWSKNLIDIANTIAGKH